MASRNATLPTLLDIQRRRHQHMANRCEGRHWVWGVLRRCDRLWTTRHGARRLCNDHYAAACMRDRIATKWRLL